MKVDSASRLAKRRELADFGIWAAIFLAKVKREELLPWSDDYQISELERTRITNSIQQFELGENGQGRSLRAAAVRYVERTGDSDYLRALDLFIKEEQRHSRYLRRFMGGQGIPRAEAHWVNDSFRWLRKRAGLELFVVVLLCAEIVAQSYYRSLGKATASALLAAICKEILRDEAEHLCFQANLLRKIRKERHHLMSAAVRFLQAVLMIGTCTVVWGAHRQVLRCGHFTFFSFIGQCLRSLRSVDKMTRC